MSVPLPARAITFLRLSFLRGAVGWGVAGTTSSFPDGVVSVDIGRAPFSNVTFVPVRFEPQEVRRDYPCAPLQWCNATLSPSPLGLLGLGRSALRVSTERYTKR